MALSILLPVAFLSVGSPGWTSRAALLLGLTPLGLVALLRAARRRRTPRLAAALLISAGAAALTSAAPVASLLGPREWYVGLLPLITFVAVWAIGDRAPAASHRWIANGIIGGAVVNALSAIFQAVQVLPLNVPDSTQFGRSSGLAGNPGQLGALAAGAAALCVFSLDRHTRWYWYLALAVLACGVNLSGARAGFASLVVGSALAARRLSRRDIALAAASVVVGFALAASLAPSTGTTAGARARAFSANGRPGVWSAGLKAAAMHPILGWGPGRFGAAATPRRSLESRRAENALFVDAHSWPIEYVATTGALGAGLLLAWLIAASRRAGGGLAIFALVIAANGLLAPSSIVVTPLAALALGAARQQSSSDRAKGRPWVTAVSIVVGSTFAVVFLMGDVAISGIGPSRSGLAAFNRARRLLPDSADMLAAGASAAASTPSGSASAKHLVEAAISREPGLASYELLGADLALRRGDDADATDHFRHALVDDPWSIPALRGLAALSRPTDPASAARLCARARTLSPRAEC